jgi:hypothetical protein
MRNFVSLNVEKLSARNRSYTRAFLTFKSKAGSRARMCKALKEHAICAQEFDLAAALRDAQKRFERISGGSK